jgi:hypothetical protein
MFGFFPFALPFAMLESLLGIGFSQVRAATTVPAQPLREASVSALQLHGAMAPSDAFLWIVTFQLLACAEPCKSIVRASPRAPSEISQISDEPRPRCSSNDPECGPEPVERSEAVCYRPLATRERLPPGQGRRGASANRCSHDGECLIAGCGNACVGYRLAEIETNCIGYDWLDEDALCGCVEGGCSFFRQ